MKVKICKTCGRDWVSSDFEPKATPEEEPKNCPKPECNGKMKISGTGWVSWTCSQCDYTDGVEYCSECGKPRHFGST